MRARGPTHHIRDRIAHHDPRCLIAYWVVAGAQLQLRAHPAVFEGSCIASPRSAHGMMPRIYGLIQQSAACDRRSQPKCGLNAAPNVALQAGHRIASQLDLRLRRQSDLATVEHMAAATNELYEPDSSAEPMDAWEFLKDLAARSTAMRPTSSRIVDSKRLGKLDRECLEAAMLSMSGEESWSSVAVVMDARNRKYSVTGLSARSPADAPAQHARPVGQRRKATASTTLTGKLDAAIAKLDSGIVAIGKWERRSRAPQGRGKSGQGSRDDPHIYRNPYFKEGPDHTTSSRDYTECDPTVLVSSIQAGAGDPCARTRLARFNSTRCAGGPRPKNSRGGRNQGSQHSRGGRNQGSSVPRKA